MHLATKGRFAVTALLDIALRAGGGPVKLAGIGERQKISQSYLEQLFGRLCKCGLARSTRGPGGGYSLARAPADITVADVILAVDDDPQGLGLRSEPGPSGPAGGASELHVALWLGLHARLLACLSMVSLQDLLDDELAHWGDWAGVEPDVPSIRRAFAPRSELRAPRPSGPNSVFALAESCD